MSHPTQADKKTSWLARRPKRPNKSAPQKEPQQPRQRAEKPPKQPKPQRESKVGPAIVKFAKDSLVDLSDFDGLLIFLGAIALTLFPPHGLTLRNWLQALLPAIVLVWAIGAAYRTFRLHNTGKGVILFLLYLVLALFVLVGVPLRLPNLEHAVLWESMTILIVPGFVLVHHESVVARRRQQEIDDQNAQDRAELAQQKREAVADRASAVQLLELARENRTGFMDALHGLTVTASRIGNIKSYIKDEIDRGIAEGIKANRSQLDEEKALMHEDYQRQVNGVQEDARRQITEAQRKVEEIMANRPQPSTARVTPGTPPSPRPSAPGNPTTVPGEVTDER